MKRRRRPKPENDDGKKHHSYCFTINNWTEKNEEAVQTVPCRFIFCGKEKAPTTGTPHLQGCVTFHNARSFSGAIKALGGGASVRIQKGSDEENITYCSKENAWHTRGEPLKPGKRTDINDVKTYVKTEGANQKDLFELATSFQAFQFGLKGLQLHQSHRTTKPEVLWYYGKTGTGKTRYAWEKNPGAFSKQHTSWDGYSGEATVIWDDFRPEHCKLSDLLIWLDRYPCTVNVKYGRQNLLFTRIVITCPFHPDTLHYGAEDMSQLLRRIDEIIEFFNF